MGRPIDLEECALVAARRLRRAIVCQLGVASPLLLAVSCRTTAPTPDEAGVTTNQSSSAESPDDSESSGLSGSTESPDGEATDDDTGLPEETETTADESESESESDDGDIKHDMMPLGDMPPPPSSCGVSLLTEDEVLAADPDCVLGPLDPDPSVVYYEICMDRPADVACADICPPDMLCEGMQDCDGWRLLGMCGVYETDDTCCLMIATHDPVVPGRPFVVAGSTRLATVVNGPSDRIAAHWLEVARGEHASVAAFARFAIVLQRFGAPARLLVEALAAAADEARHAEQTLALAREFAGQELEFGALVIEDALRDTDDLEAALRAAVLEGCVDETLSAHEAACLAAHAEDPRVAIVLEQIAADEARHAALAWKFVAWVLEQRPELRPVVASAFASVTTPRVGELHELDRHDTDALALGCPPARLRASWRRLGLRELVTPCAARLLGAAAHEELRA